MPLFELKTTDNQTINLDHPAETIDALLALLASEKFLVGKKVEYVSGRRQGEPVPFGLMLHNVAQVKVRPEGRLRAIAAGDG